MTVTHKLVRATGDHDFFPTRCGISDTAPDRLHRFIPVHLKWAKVTCPKCLTFQPKPKKQKCSCPANCRFCGRRRSKDVVGHYCKTQNCQWQFGYSECL